MKSTCSPTSAAAYVANCAGRRIGSISVCTRICPLCSGFIRGAASDPRAPRPRGLLEGRVAGVRIRDAIEGKGD
eukprot:3215094-Prymnesium_polylepis.2